MVALTTDRKWRGDENDEINKGGDQRDNANLKFWIDVRTNDHFF